LTQGIHAGNPCKNGDIYVLTWVEDGNGKRGISPEMAVRLSKVFGGTAEGWLLQQVQYDLSRVRAGRMKLKRLQVA